MSEAHIGPPEALKDAGRAFWKAVTKEYTDLLPADLALLEEACRVLDTIASLEAAVTPETVLVTGSTGQPKLNPAITETRLQRRELARLLDQLGLPADVEASGAKPSSPTARRARKAAETRWRTRGA